MQAELTRRAVLMWGYVEDKCEPDESVFPPWVRPVEAGIDLSQVQAILEAQEQAQISEQEIEALAASALKTKEALDAVEAAYEAIRKKLQEALGERETMRCGEALFGWQTRKGQVNYKVIPELIGINLDQYRGKETRTFYIKRVDSSENA
jgi:hypothetical protein